MQRLSGGAKRQASTRLGLLLTLLCAGLCVTRSDALAEEEPIGWQFESPPLRLLGRVLTEAVRKVPGEVPVCRPPGRCSCSPPVVVVGSPASNAS
jgi:hypothetical protein